MALFSQRKGIRPLSKTLQVKSIDEELRNRLWNVLTICAWNHWIPEQHSEWGPDRGDAVRVEQITGQIWHNYFKKPLDAMPPFHSDRGSSGYRVIREHFFNGEWWQVYDFIEFILKISPNAWKIALKKDWNTVLESEKAAYRIVDDEVVEITDDNEIEAIETALEKSVKTVQSHLSRALDLVSDRKQPDYRNSIKESISSVEAVCKAVAGKPKAELGDCIKTLKNHGSVHPAFEQALLKLYGYTSEEGGIRHALTEECVSPTYADAKFMLVACSAFVNFLWTKASELGIRIDGQ